MSNCLNCKTSLTDDGKFCPICGQKRSIGKLSLKVILSDFFSNLFNIENKFWKTFLDIWIPAKLARAYVAGERIKYYNPLRFFLISLFTFFALSLLQINEGVTKVDDIFENQKKKAWKKELSQKYDSVTKESDLSPDSILAIKMRLFDLKKRYNIDKVELNAEYTQVLNKIINENPLENVSRVEHLIDSLKMVQVEKDGGNLDSIMTSNEAEIYDPNEFTVAPGIMGNDFFMMTESELIEKYAVGKWYKKILYIQLQKIMQNLDTSFKFIFGNATWAIVLVIILNALFFKLLYFRRNYLFVEHFIFQLYGHTRILLAGIVFMLINRFISAGEFFSFLWPILGVSYLFFGMWYYYRQSLPKTFIKFCLTLISYFYALLISMMLILGILFLII